MKVALPELKDDSVLFGDTKIFLRNKALVILEKKFEEKAN